MDPLSNFLDYAKAFRGVPYLWGGNNPMTGMDCSGYIAFILRSRGLVGLREDISAQGLYDRFRKKGTVSLDWRNLEPGTLLFYGKTATSVEHVAISLDRYTVLEAGGGDRTCTTLERAKELGACVRERAVGQRLDILLMIQPTYPWA